MLGVRSNVTRARRQAIENILTSACGCRSTKKIQKSLGTSSTPLMW